MPGDIYPGGTYPAGSDLITPPIIPAGGVPPGPLTPYGRVFTYPCYNLLTGGMIDAPPLNAVTFGRQINQPGPLNAQLAISDPRVQAMAWQEATRPGTAAVFVDYLGVLIWGGIWWTRRYKETQKTLVLGAAEFGSYFKSRVQAADYSTTWQAGGDPMVIAKQIVTDALAKPNGNLMGGITLTLNPVGGSGASVAPSYPGTSLQTIESIIQTLSQMGYSFGFDYSFDVAYLPGTKTPGVTLNFWYPRQGRLASQSKITVLSQECLDWDYDEDATAAANSVTETGSGSTLTPATASAVIPGYPLLEKAVARSQVTDESTLTNIALGDLALYVTPPVTPALYLPIPVPDATGRLDPSRLTFGGFQLGDDLIFRVDPVSDGGSNTSPRFPNGMTFEWRVTNWSCTVPDRGGQPPTLKFDMAVPPISTIPPPAPPVL